MKNEQDVRDLRDRIEVAFNDRNNRLSQHFDFNTIVALDWVLGEYEEWRVIDALKRYDESKSKKKVKIRIEK